MPEQQFSRRTGWDTVETEWGRLLRERRASGRVVCDLTASNPTQCGFRYDAESVLSALAAPAALHYDPEPKGLLRAREAVTGYYAGHQAVADPERIFLTTSTSEAYSYLFRLLCNPGDEVLIAQPSYPLFDFLADLDDVRLVAYPLFYDYGWHLDAAALRERITPCTKAIALVHPNNPTGHYTKETERKLLEDICAEFGLALIVDEVFLDYPLGELREPSFTAGEHPVLTFVLSGLSKIAGLPQMKVAWIACFGPGAALREACLRLEVIADTFLSMNAPMQAALPVWLAGRHDIQAQIGGRIRENLAWIDRTFPPSHTAQRLVAEAGWYSVLRVPALQPDEETVLRLLREHDVAVHGGNFFGFGGQGRLVWSLLSETAVVASGVNAIAEFLKV